MKGTIMAFIAIALFSLYTVFGKILLTSLSPFVILILNQLLASIVLILLLGLIKKIKEIKETSAQDFKIMGAISLLTAVGAPLLFLFGLSLTSATNSILIGKSEAILTTILAIFFLRDKLTSQQVIGGTVMFAGVIIIATNMFANQVILNLGDVFIFLSALLYAFGTILFKKYMHHIQPEVIVALRNLFGAIILFIISLFMIDISAIAQTISFEFILALLGLVILTTLGGQYLWYKALEHTTATKVSLAGLSSPLIGVIYAITLLNETLSHAQIIGGIFILLGLIFLEVHFKKIHTPKRHRNHLKLKHWPHP